MPNFVSIQVDSLHAGVILWQDNKAVNSWHIFATANHPKKHRLSFIIKNVIDVVTRATPDAPEVLPETIVLLRVTRPLYRDTPDTKEATRNLIKWAQRRDITCCVVPSDLVFSKVFGGGYKTDSRTDLVRGVAQLPLLPTDTDWQATHDSVLLAFIMGWYYIQILARK